MHRQTRNGLEERLVMHRSFQALVADDVVQLAVVVVGLPVACAPAGVQVFVIALLLVVAAATSTTARTAWRSLPTGPAPRAPT